VLELATKANIPVTTTLMGLGAFPETHPLSLKMLGMHGTVYANCAVMDSDLIIAVGARFDDRITGRIDAFAPGARIIHVDIDPTSISKSIKVDIPVVGDARGILRSLISHVQPAAHDEWLAKISDWKAHYPLRYAPDGLKPQYVIEQIARPRGAKPSSQRRWGRTRCGRRSGTRTRSRATSSRRAGWARWATASPPQSEHSLPAPTRPCSISRAKAHRSRREGIPHGPRRPSDQHDDRGNGIGNDE